MALNNESNTTVSCQKPGNINTSNSLLNTFLFLQVTPHLPALFYQWNNGMDHTKLKTNIIEFFKSVHCRVRLKPDGTWWRTGGEMKGKMANGVGSQYSHTASERGVSTITNAGEHNLAASSRLNWRPRRCKWTSPFRRKMKSGFCECTITFQTHSTKNWVLHNIRTT